MFITFSSLSSLYFSFFNYLEFSLTRPAIPLPRIFSGFTTPFIFFRSRSFLIFFSTLFNFFSLLLSISLLSSSSHPPSLFFIITPLSLVSPRFLFSSLIFSFILPSLSFQIIHTPPLSLTLISFLNLPFLISLAFFRSPPPPQGPPRFGRFRAQLPPPIN